MTTRRTSEGPTSATMAYLAVKAYQHQCYQHHTKHTSTVFTQSLRERERERERERAD